jgi:hypothetical protein
MIRALSAASLEERQARRSTVAIYITVIPAMPQPSYHGHATASRSGRRGAAR